MASKTFPLSILTRYGYAPMGPFQTARAMFGDHYTFYEGDSLDVVLKKQGKSALLLEWPASRDCIEYDARGLVSPDKCDAKTPAETGLTLRIAARFRTTRPVAGAGNAAPPVGRLIGAADETTTRAMILETFNRGETVRLLSESAPVASFVEAKWRLGPVERFSDDAWSRIAATCKSDVLIAWRNEWASAESDDSLVANLTEDLVAAFDAAISGPIVGRVARGAEMPPSRDMLQIALDSGGEHTTIVFRARLDPAAPKGSPADGAETTNVECLTSRFVALYLAVEMFLRELAADESFKLGIGNADSVEPEKRRRFALALYEQSVFAALTTIRRAGLLGVPGGTYKGWIYERFS